MTTSGTASFDLPVWEAVEEAYERAGLELRSGYQLATARRSLNLLLAEWSNKGINLWTMDNPSISLTAGTATYTLPDDTIDMLDAVIRTTVNNQQQDYVIGRIGVSQYNSIPNKLSQARPLQYFVQRIVPPTVTFWPVPDSSASWTLSYWRLRRMQDTGTGGSNTMDVPSRLLPALCSGLAYYISLKAQDQNAFARSQGLKAQYMEDFQVASEEDRDRSSWNLVPNPESYRI